MTAPEKIYGWLNGQLSLARHYGGCKFNGHEYQIDYLDPDAPLVRMDVFKAEFKAKSTAAKTASRDQATKQKQAQAVLV